MPGRPTPRRLALRPKPPGRRRPRGRRKIDWRNQPWPKIALAVLAITVCLTALIWGAIRSAHKWRDDRAEARAVDVEAEIRHWADARGLDPHLVRAVVHQESRFKADAVSPVGARGLMQLMPAAKADAIRAGEPDGDLFDPSYNLRVGTWYLRWMIDRFDGDVRLALAAYNWGPGNVRDLVRRNPGRTSAELVTLGSVPRETKAYVPSVLDKAEAYRSGSD